MAIWRTNMTLRFWRLWMAVRHCERTSPCVGPGAEASGPAQGRRWIHLKRSAMWVVAVTILGVAGLIGFQLLVTLVTLD
jgi:hypothetical protein